MKNVSKTNHQKGLALNLQRFADNLAPTTPGSDATTASHNLQMGVRTYRPQFIRVLSAVFAKRAYFSEFFEGGIQTLDDISESDTAFELKVNNTPVSNSRYNTGANVGMGTGTSKSNRFGDIVEIIYKRLAVGYSWDYGWHEGIDKHTVNMGLDAAIADRTLAQAKFKMDQFNTAHGKFISETATPLETEIAGAAPTQTEVVAAFEEASSLYTDLEVSGTWRAYVNSDVWNVLVNNDLVTNDAKSAGVNIATDELYSFKDFKLTRIPNTVKGDEKDLAYFTVDASAHAFTGMATARVIDAYDFDGVAFQGAGKAGEFMLDDNKPTVRKLVSKP